MISIFSFLYSKSEILKIEIDEMIYEQFLNNISKTDTGDYQISAVITNESITKRDMTIDLSENQGGTKLEKEEINLMINKQDFEFHTKYGLLGLCIDSKSRIKWNFQIDSDDYYPYVFIDDKNGNTAIWAGDVKSIQFRNIIPEPNTLVNYLPGIMLINNKCELKWVRKLENEGSLVDINFLTGNEIYLTTVEKKDWLSIICKNDMNIKNKLNINENKQIAFEKFNEKGESIIKKTYAGVKGIIIRRSVLNDSGEISVGGTSNSSIIYEKEYLNVDKGREIYPMKGCDFVAKYDNLGNIAWMKKVQDAFPERIFSINLLNSGDVIVLYKADSTHYQGVLDKDDLKRLPSNFFESRIICLDSHTGDIKWEKELPDVQYSFFDENEKDKLCINLFIRENIFYKGYKLKKGYRYGAVLDTLGVLQEIYEVPFEVTDDNIDYLKLDFTNNCVLYCIKEGTDYILYEEDLEKFKITKK